MKLTDLQNAIAKKKTRSSQEEVSEDVVLAVSKYSEKVSDWLADHGMVRKSSKNNFVYGMENFSLNDTTEEKVIKDIEDLMTAMNLPVDSATEATVKEIIGSSLVAIAGRGAGEVWSDYATPAVQKNTGGVGVTHMAMESFIPSNIMRHFVSYDQLNKESFGVDTDKAIPDMRSSIVVGIMKFFNSITG